jgi:hypothetical protein
MNNRRKGQRGVARVAALYTLQRAATAANRSVACILANDELRVSQSISSSGAPTGNYPGQQGGVANQTDFPTYQSA